MGVMFYLLFTSVGVFMRLLCSASGTVGDLTEYCSGEIFRPQCQDDAVIVMNEAQFGRIRIGKCAKRDYGISGCYNDELQYTDEICSGKTNCQLIIPDITMKGRLSCLEDLSAHFVASFTCQTVFSPGVSKCRTQQTVQVSKKAEFLSSHVTMETSCGLHDTPWILVTEDGQQIEITLIDFSWNNQTMDGTCGLNYGYILDVENDGVVNICGGRFRRKHLYLSSGSTLQIILQKFVLEDNKFLVEYKAVGCPEYKAPDHTWQERTNHTLTVGCHTDSQTWKLTCIDHIWLGHVGNCSKVTTMTTTVVTSTEAITKQESNRMIIPAITKNHVIVFTMGCITLLVCCCIIVVGLYYTKRCDMEIKQIKSPMQNMPVGFGDTLKSRKSVIAYRPGQQNNENPPTYTFPLAKEQCPPPVPHRTSTCRGDMSESMMSDYLAPQGGENDSAMYYILENLDEMRGQSAK